MHTAQLSIQLMETALIPNHLFLLPEHLSASDRNPTATAKPNYTLSLSNPTLALLEQCTSMAHLRQLHARMITTGLARDAFASSRLIAFCGLSLRGDLPYALKLFSLLHSPPPSLFVHNLMIRSFSRSNRPDLSLRFYIGMLCSRCVPDAYTFPFLLKSCSHLPSPDQGLQVHAHVVKNGLDTDPHVSNSLVGMYSEFGLLEAAKTAFARTPNGHSCQVSLATMIGALIRNGRPEEAIALFSSKKWREGSLDQITLATVLSACARVGNLKLGKEIHAYAEENRVELGLPVRNSLINMYAKSGELAVARTLFDTTTDKDSVSWNVMISGLAENGYFAEGLELFAEMKSNRNVNADRATFLALATSCNNLCFAKIVHGYIRDFGFASDVPICNAIIDTYSRIGHVAHGRRVFDQMQERDVVTWNSMIAGYAKCGSIDTARSLFDQMPRKDNVSWSTMILGYVRNDRPKEAIAVYKDLQSDGSTAPDAVTVLSVLTACSALGALEEGVSVHNYIRRNSIRVDGSLATALIDMYAKCGQLKSAVEVFESMPRRDKDVLAWTAMISGHATNGDAEGALKVFWRMLERTKPNAVTFLAVLSACAHAGRVEEGWSAYRRMVEEYGVEPGMAHLGCMVDLLGRAGNLKEALEFVEGCGYEVDASVWGALLGACRIHGNAEMGMAAARRMIGLEPRHDGAHVGMCNMYAEGMKWEERKEVSRRMREEMVLKEVGMSWIEVNGTLHEFTAGNIYS